MSFPTLAHRRFLRNDFSTLHEEVNKLFESAFAPVRRAAVLATEYVPACDIVRDGAAVTVRVDLPGVRKEDIDVDLPFSHYALDSVATVELTADIEDWLELRLSPTLVWDYPTISVLARHLADLKAAFR